MPAGRPTTYRKEFAKIAADVCARGATNVEIANALNISTTTLTEWQRKYQEFAVAIKDAKTEYDQKVEEALYRRATGYDKSITKADKDGNPFSVEQHFPPDPTSMIFWLKNRQPKRWRDKAEVEHQGSVNLVAVIKDKDALDE